MGKYHVMYMTRSWTYDLAKHISTGGAQSGFMTISPYF